MNDLSGTPTPTRYTTERPICIAVMAMGGQGGGVLADWIVELAESQSWHAQSTSVPGVAQRTGATIYYVEMLPPKAGRAPILSLMPAPGEVDIVLAAELIEAGRSILRGLVTPDRTTLIASTHRLYSTAEKEKPGDATADQRAGRHGEHAGTSVSTAERGNRLAAGNCCSPSVSSGAHGE